MKPSELLQKTKRALLSGPASRTWIRGSFRGFAGQRCISACMADVANETLAEFEVESMARWALAKAAPGGLGFIWVNDRGPTGLWGLIALIGKAQRRLEAEGR